MSLLIILTAKSETKILVLDTSSESAINLHNKTSRPVLNERTWNTFGIVVQRYDWMLSKAEYQNIEMQILISFQG